MNEIKEEYNRIAEEYDKRWAEYLRSTHNETLKLLQPKKGEKILDVSGGTGLLAQKIIKKGGKVTLTDFSEEMLNQAKKKLGGKVRIVKTKTDRLPFKTGTFDKVINVSALHYYPQPDKALSEMRRVLKKKGMIIIVDWCRDPLHFKIFDAAMRVLKKHKKTYTSKELTNMLSQQRFKIVKTRKWKLGLWHLMGVKAEK